MILQMRNQVCSNGAQIQMFRMMRHCAVVCPGRVAHVWIRDRTEQAVTRPTNSGLRPTPSFVRVSGCQGLWRALYYVSNAVWLVGGHR